MEEHETLNLGVGVSITSCLILTVIQWAVSSVWSEHRLCTAGVEGSNPSWSTNPIIKGD